MKIKRSKTAVALCLIIALLLSQSIHIFAISDSVKEPGISEENSMDKKQSGNPAVTGNKEEVIYAMVSANGHVKSVYAVNHFDVIEPGVLTDYGKYESTTNLTDTSPITYTDHSVSAYAKKGDYYYQGNLGRTNLPWHIELTYMLNGQIITPENLAGKSGNLELQIKTSPNKAVPAEFYENYMLQISVTLPNEKCGKINAPDATFAGAGSNTVLTYTVMPKNNANFLMRVFVQDFTMPGIQITGMPFSVNMDLPDTDEMVDDFEELASAIAELSNGAESLSNGAKELNSGGGELAEGSKDIQAGLSTLSNNAPSFIRASNKINKALTQIYSSLTDSSVTGSGIGDIEQLPTALSSLADGLEQISIGLGNLNQGFSQAYNGLDMAMQSIPGQAYSQTQIDTLKGLTSEQSVKDALDALYGGYLAGQTAKATYDSTKTAFDAVHTTIDTLIGSGSQPGSIGTIIDTLNILSSSLSEALSEQNITQQLTTLTAGLKNLSKSYTQFHDGLREYMSGVTTLNTGYSGLYSGLTEFIGGVGDLQSGIAELNDGTNQLASETSAMPDTAKTKIDEMMEDYTGSDFHPISFLSSANDGIFFVQFVMQSEPIELPDIKDTPIESEQKKESLWERFIELFRSDGSDD